MLELSKHEAVATPTPMTVLQLAVQQGATVETLRGLMELQRQWEANEARKAYVAAMNAFKADPPSLEKIKTVDFASKTGGRVNYNYAPLDYVAKVIGAALSKHGLSFRWDVDQSKPPAIRVTCKLEHVAGHSESVSIEGMLHADERMNHNQRLSATLTYLERYSLLAITGMSTSEMDTDGNVVKMDDLSEQLDWIANACDVEELKKLYQQAYRKAQQAGDQNAMRAIIAAKDKRRKELGA